MIERIKGLIKDEEGAAMPEYALLVALIAVVVMVGAGFLGAAIKDKFDEATVKLGGATE